MRVRVHRGTREIGGSCVEVEARGERLVLDLGMPLNAEDPDATPLPIVEGLNFPDDSLRGVVLSHGRRDHWGLMPKLPPHVPVVMGAATERIMRAAAPFLPDGFSPKVAAHLTHREPLRLGSFCITPFLVDHSGFDAYALLVDAEQRRLFYSGDLRSHGRKGKLFDALLRSPPHDVDLMLMEGSSLGRIDDNASFPTETDLEQHFIQSFRKTPGAALVACSAQNIDRVVTVHRAAKRCGRQLVVDAYAAEVLKATGHASIPKPADDWTDVKVFIPQRQRASLKKKGIAALVDGYKGRRIWPENLVQEAPRSVMLFRPWMLDEFAKLGILHDARVIWSQWEGYLKEGPAAQLRENCKQGGVPFDLIHTSGHASIRDLVRLSDAISPRRLVAIHTFERHRFPALFENVVRLDDGEWLDL